MANYWFIYNNSDGSMYSHYLGDVDTWTNVPEGCSTLMFPDTDVNAQNAFDNPKDYIVKDGKLFFNVTDQEQLDRAKNNQLSLVQSSCMNSTVQPFTSDALGSTHTYIFDATAKTRYDAIYSRFHNDPTYTTEEIYTVEEGYLAHDKDQFTQVWTDGFNNEKALDAKYRGLVAQINAIQLTNYSNVNDAIADIQKQTWN